MHLAHARGLSASPSWSAMPPTAVTSFQHHMQGPLDRVTVQLAILRPGWHKRRSASLQLDNVSVKLVEIHAAILT